MRLDLTDTRYADEREMLPPLQSISPERGFGCVPLEPVLCVMSVSVLAGHCMREISNDRRGEPSVERSCVELLRRATVQCDSSAWAYMQQLFSVIVHGWLRRHPNREVAYRLDREENYVAQAFERFWQATTQNQQVEFGTLVAGLQYLRASVHGAIVDTLRAHSRSREVALPEPGFPGKPRVEDSTNNGDYEYPERYWAYATTAVCLNNGITPQEMVQKMNRWKRENQWSLDVFQAWGTVQVRILYGRWACR